MKFVSYLALDLLYQSLKEKDGLYSEILVLGSMKSKEKRIVSAESFTFSCNKLTTYVHILQIVGDNSLFGILSVVVLLLKTDLW